MKKVKILSGILIQIMVLFFMLSLSEIDGGYLSDTYGDADSDIVYCDITRINVTQDVYSIQVAENPVINSTQTVRLDYNMWIDTSGEDEYPDTTTWSTDVYEYVAHMTCRSVSDEWINESYLMATRYYLTENAGTKTNGTFYWNKNTSSWQETNPNQEIAIIDGNIVRWNVSGAIFREQLLGTGTDIGIQAVANAAYALVVRDHAPDLGWCDEFINISSLPNYAPVLNNGLVTPLNGTTDTVFTFSVNYTDMDNDAPEYINVKIDDTIHAMNKIAYDANYQDGCLYIYETMLPIGLHNYSFRTSDGVYISTLLPTSGEYSGPEVEQGINITTTPPDLPSFTIGIQFVVTIISFVILMPILSIKRKKN